MCSIVFVENLNLHFNNPFATVLHDGHLCPSYLSTDKDVRRTVRFYLPLAFRFDPKWSIAGVHRG